MKKTIIIVFLMIFSLSASTAFAIKHDPKSESDKPAVPNNTENKLSEEELSRLTKRSEEIRDMEKSKQTVEIGQPRHRTRRDHNAINRDNRRHGGYIYAGAGTLLLIIILVILLA
jgi:hypothetical protein